MRRIPWRMVGLLGAAGLLAGCGASEAATPTWVPQPSITLEAGPHGSTPGQPGGPSQGPSGGAPFPGPSGPNGPAPSGGSSGGSGVLATDLNAPTGMVILPDGSGLVGERTTGRIVHVQPRAGQPVDTVRTITGLSTTGDGGLLDLALSPTYDEDRLIYAYITTPQDNRVIDFTLTGPQADVLTGIPRGATGNTGRLMFDARGLLYIGTGDAGTRQLAANPTSLAGKVLRVDAIGHPAPGNPNPNSPIYTTGHHTVNGLCSSPELGGVYETEAPNEVNSLSPGADYGWPTPARTSRKPANVLPSAHSGAAGCAVEGNAMFVATTDGQALLGALLGANGKVGAFTVIPLDKPYGRLRTVVAAPDGALWLTTTNKDGHGRPSPDDERVIRIVQIRVPSDTPPV